MLQLFFLNKGSIFGADLEKLYAHHEGVPEFLTYFFNHIETEGIKDPELYRWSTTKKDKLLVTKLKMRVEMGEKLF